MRIFQMNLLAPMWVTSIYKQLSCYPLYKKADRISLSIQYMMSHPSDVYCLSEVEASDVPLLDRRLGSDWTVLYTSHEVGFWSEWLEGDAPWKSNGVCIALRNSVLQLRRAEHVSLGTGCRACHAVCEWLSDGSLVSISSVHFSTDEHKWKEASSLLAFLSHVSYDLSIISGDYNFIDVSLFHSLGYVDGRASCEHSEQTTVIPQGRIDHTLVRSDPSSLKLEATITSVIHDLGDPCSTVSQNGSDHYATTSVIKLS